MLQPHRQSIQSFDWSSLPRAPPYSHHSPFPYTPFILPHIVTHTHHSCTNQPTLFVSTNNTSLTPIHNHPHQPSDLIHSSSSHTPYYYHHSFSRPRTPTPAYLTHSYPDCSLSFYSHSNLFDRVVDSVPVETPTPTGSDYSCDDIHKFKASIYCKLNNFLLDNDIVPTLRVFYPYSSDIFVGPPTSAFSSQGIDFPSSLSQSLYSFARSNSRSTASTEGDANSLPESTLSDGYVSPVPPSFPEVGGPGVVKLSDSVLANINAPPPTHAYPPTTFTPPTHDKESIETRGQEASSDYQAVYVFNNTTKSLEQTNFERGSIDFTGLDSFENIQAHIDKMLK